MDRSGVPEFRKQAPRLVVVFICLLVGFLAVGVMNGMSNRYFIGMIVGGAAGLLIFLGISLMGSKYWRERVLREPEPLQDERTTAVAKKAMLKSLQVLIYAIGALIVLTMASPLKAVLTAMNVLIILMTVIIISNISFAVYYSRKGLPE